MICRKYPVPKTEKERKEALDTSTKFLVVRHPLDRLVSSYLDKVRTPVRLRNPIAFLGKRYPVKLSAKVGNPPYLQRLSAKTIC
jgi:hypothetical protein